MRADLLIVGAGEIVTAPPGEKPLTGPDLDRPVLLRDGAIAIVGGRIAAVGAGAEVRRAYPERDAARIVDAGGSLVAPGFVDCHTHLPFAGTREMEFDARARGETYEAIAAEGGGIRASVRRLRETSEADLASLVAARLDAAPARGITTIEAKSGYGLSVDEELKQLRALRRGAEASPVEVIPTFLGAHEVPDEFRGDREGYIRLVTEAMIPAVAREDLARFCDVFCDRGVFTVEEARRILVSANGRGLRPKLHADELADVGAAALAAEVGAVSADHLLHASDAGLAALARAGVVGVLLPGTALTLGLPYAPARRMIALGVPVALATDYNPGSTLCRSMSLALTLAVTQMKMTPAEAWMAATANAAAAVGEGARLGRIQPGFDADLVIHACPDHRHVPYHYGEEHACIVVKTGAVVWSRAPGSCNA